MVHLWCSKRPNDVGLDLYGRPSGSIWFYIPTLYRKRVTILNLLSVGFHFSLQGARLLWNDYRRSHSSPGTVVLNICLAGTITFGILGGLYQGHMEGQLRKRQPESFAPALNFYIAKGVRMWREGGYRTLSEAAIAQYHAYCEDRQNQAARLTKTGLQGMSLGNSCALYWRRSFGDLSTKSPDTSGSPDIECTGNQTHAKDARRSRVQRAASANHQRKNSSGRPQLDAVMINSSCQMSQPLPAASIRIEQDVDTVDYAV